MTIRVLMFGWEFPPFNTGGLGTACYGLTKELVKNGAKVTFVLPKGPKALKSHNSHVDIVIANNIEIADLDMRHVDSLLAGYMTAGSYQETLQRVRTVIERDGAGDQGLYGKNLYEEVYRYAEQAKMVAQLTDYDIIHAHDWMTYQAGMEAKRISNKPLVIHVHATEFDRTGGHPNQYIYDIERAGMHAADMIICVSNYTKGMVLQHYGVPEEKVRVVHNGVDFTNFTEEAPRIQNNDKVVLFLGRVTIQKGPDYFLYAAKRVLEHEPDAKFVVAGNGDMMPFLVNKATEMGIHDKFLFTGFLRGKDIDRAYKMARVYVMPSISEPFGITPLEAMRNGTPVIISKQSGVSEVVNHAFKVDFWDIDEMSNKIISILRHSPLKEEIASNAEREVSGLNWETPAQKCMAVYSETLSRVA